MHCTLRRPNRTCPSSAHMGRAHTCMCGCTKVNAAWLRWRRPVQGMHESSTPSKTFSTRIDQHARAKAAQHKHPSTCKCIGAQHSAHSPAVAIRPSPPTESARVAAFDGAGQSLRRPAAWMPLSVPDVAVVKMSKWTRLCTHACMHTQDSCHCTALREHTLRLPGGCSCAGLPSPGGPYGGSRRPRRWWRRHAWCVSLRLQQPAPHN